MFLLRFRDLLIVLLVVFCFVLPAGAATLDDYQQRIESAAIDTDAVAQGADYSPETIAELRRLVPATEKVDWEGGSIETDNRWLHDELETLAQEKDAARRRAKMAAIGERLQAIAEKIDELKKAQAGARTKDEDKQKLAEILRRAEYQKPPPPEESLFQRWYRKVLEWLSKSLPDAPTAPESAPSGFGSLKFFLQVLIYAIVIGLIVFLAYQFGPAIARRAGWRRKEKKRDRVILGERIGADETAENLFGEAERLAGQGQLREAIRKGYIAALCELADRKIVRLAGHKTNRDYLRDVRKTREGMFENMSGLTGTYERNWYGLRMSEPTDWEDFRERYRQTIAGV